LVVGRTDEFDNEAGCDASNIATANTLLPETPASIKQSVCASSNAMLRRGPCNAWH